MTKQLQNKLKAYSALTAAGVLSAANADAAIIHTNVNYTGGYETYDIDVDNNGSNDFAIHAVNWGTCYGISGNLINFENFGSNVMMATSSAYFPQLLSSGNMISSSQNFGNASYVWSACYGYLSNGVYVGGTYNGNPSWGSANGQTTFMGVRFDISGNTHYGWLRFTFNSDLSSWTLVDMAYNCVPGEGLTAGQTTGGSAPTPDAGSLADFYACGSVNSVGDLAAPTATSDCGASLVATTNAAFPISAATTITWTYDDGYGNTSTQNQNIYFVVDLGVTLLNPTTLSSSETDVTATYQWVDCDNGNAAISGATSKDFSPSATGNYAVEVTVGSCTATSPCTYFTLPLGVNSADKQITNVHPNPATEEIIINLAEVGANTTMTVVDVTGKIVKVINVTDNKTVINLTDLNSGIYLVKISSDQGMNTVKFVKK